MTSTTQSARRPHSFYAAILIFITLWMSIPGLSSIPPIDRDESRYVQATVQMVESGDYLNIKFQDDARNKKPAGIYWMQAGPVKLFTDTGERRMWPHRLPSVLGALIAVLATYWGGIVVFGRRGAFIAGGILAVSALFVFEAHVAKTDAMLCGMSAVVLACLLRLRRAPARLPAILLWAALGVGIMIKGPILPALLVLTLVGLFLWEREAGWMKSLVNWPGILLCILLVVPWAITITLATDGAFFKDAIGGDLAPKLAGVQEKHGGSPGYYLTTLALLFWPGSLFLFCAFVFGFKAARQKDEGNIAISSCVRLLLMWILPYWFILEIVPTKLPNYLLPVYPALALLCGGAVTAMMQVKAFPVSRKLGAVIFFIAAFILLFTIMGISAAYSDAPGYSKWFIIPLTALIFVCAGSLWAGRTSRALMSGLILAAIMMPLTFSYIVPNMNSVLTARNIEATLTQAGIALPRKNGPQIYSPHFTEPSLVYRLGTDIVLGDKSDAAIDAGMRPGDILLFNQAEKPLKAVLKSMRSEKCFDDIGIVKGLNYSNGDLLEIAILQSKTCESDKKLIAPQGLP